MWFPIFEILAEAYHWTLDQVLWGLTLPQIMRYLTTRSERIERQNRQMKNDSDDSETQSQPRTAKDVERKRQQLIERQRQWEESQRLENLPLLSDIAGDLASSMSPN